MARKPAEIVNGYKVPGGRGGAAVAKACQLIIQNPGIKQGMSWILSPTGRSLITPRQTGSRLRARSPQRNASGPVRRWVGHSDAFPMSTPTSSETHASDSARK
jgi:hypothetical protein